MSTEGKRLMEVIPEEFAANMFPDVAKDGETFEALDVTGGVFTYTTADVVQDGPAQGWKLEDETEPGGALAGRIASDVVVACQRIGRDIERAGAKVRKLLIRDNVRAKFAVSVLISVEVNGKRFANYVDAVVVSTFVNHVENWLADKGVTLGVDHV